MIEYKVINLLTGVVTIVIATSIYEAIRKGKRYFTGPNRNKVPVQVLN